MLFVGPESAQVQSFAADRFRVGQLDAMAATRRLTRYQTSLYPLFSIWSASAMRAHHSSEASISLLPAPGIAITCVIL